MVTASAMLRYPVMHIVLDNSLLAFFTMPLTNLDIRSRLSVVDDFFAFHFTLSSKDEVDFGRVIMADGQSDFCFFPM